MLAIFVVSGQLSAYPLLCAMPGMDMGHPDSLFSDHGAISASMTHLEITDAGDTVERGLPDAVGFNLCEQICGYCLSYNHPGSPSINLYATYRTAEIASLYSRFTPSEPINGPFRPPISV